MQHSSWKKCDLQVATPAWKFRLPSGSTYDFSTSADRQSFLDQYMGALRSNGVDVIALADHNTGEWIDATKEAGARHGIVVFPGCEVTTGSGSDGAHLLIIGDLSKSSQDFDRLLESVLGFTGVRRFSDRNEPASSTKTVEQILDALPDGYLAIAPHVFGENGLASDNTVQGDLRWRCLHHAKLSAVDPGDCAVIDSGSFRHRFCRRELNHFPCLQDLPFIATSDAYALEDLGRRFTWIRMGTPSLEALRQSFLDYRARILCDWDTRLAAFPNRNPNSVRHGWIERIDLGGDLGNSNSGLSVSLHPNLNVIIGGRGSGKSTIVAAARELYGSTEELPERIKEDVESFSQKVFGNAQLGATHRLEESQQQQGAKWSAETGSLIDGTNVPTDFPVRVFSQKELFERAAGDKRDPYLASRSLLALLDQSLHLDMHGAHEVGGLPRQIEGAKTEWAATSRSHAELVKDLHQLPALRERAQMLRGQVDAFSSPEVKEKLSRISAVRKREATLKQARQDVAEMLNRIDQMAIDAGLRSPTADDADAPPSYVAAREGLAATRAAVSGGLAGIAFGVKASLSEWEESSHVSEWKKLVEQAEADLRDYTEGLASQGLSQDAFTRLSQELAQTEGTLQTLLEREARSQESSAAVDGAWNNLLSHLGTVRALRSELLDEIQRRSQQLRFKTAAFVDQTAWVESIRELMALRSDGFVNEVPALARWLWDDPSTREQRWAEWRKALAFADFETIRDQLSVRSNFFDRLARLDEAMRLRIATEIPEDVVHMEFLKTDGDPSIDSDWQSITEGSPGQRTAAMLAFVLHHGNEPLVIDQPEDDLDSEWIAKLVVEALRASRWNRQLVVVTHNANIPVLGDADQVVALENRQGTLRIRTTAGTDGTDQPHIGPVEFEVVRADIQKIMEGGIDAFLRRERRYNTETLAARQPRK